MELKRYAVELVDDEGKTHRIEVYASYLSDASKRAETVWEFTTQENWPAKHQIVKLHAVELSHLAEVAKTLTKGQLGEPRLPYLDHTKADATKH